MISTRIAVLGLVALMAAGCATGTRSLVGSNGNGFASPATMDDQQQQCEGWYDAAARVCDNIGD